MRQDFIYQTQDIPHYHNIHAQLSEFALDQNPKFRQQFNHLDLDLLRVNCPLIIEWFHTHNLTPEICALIQFPPGSDHRGTHTDTTPNYLALNFGIKNLHSTYTAFYRMAAGAKATIKTLPNGRPYNCYSSAQLQEIGRIDLVKPTWINTHVPHAVHNLTLDTRISLSFRFKQNPWHMV
jgi:hypothetical protein